jgi:hypothetical protein
MKNNYFSLRILLCAILQLILPWIIFCINLLF